MNHCQPGRVLEPNHKDFPVLSGFVITAPLADSTNYKHFVFCDGQLYKMPIQLFRLNSYRGMKITQILRCEKSLEFGDNIYFTANSRYEVIDYEMGLQVHEAKCKEGLNMVKTVAILPPKNKEKFCWTQLFGNIALKNDMFERLYQQAKHDVPIFAWISVEIERGYSDWELKSDFYEFIEVAVDERKIAWETDWRANNVNRPISDYLDARTDDENEEEEEAPINPIIEKKEDQILDVLLKLEGYLIDTRELFCPQLKDHCVEIGLWSKSEAKVDNNYNLLGKKFRFDAYYNDVLQTYIAYYYEDITEITLNDENEGVYERECKVILEDYGTKLLQIEIFPSDNYGIFYNTSNFGLIADHHHVLGPFPIFMAEMEVDSLWVNVIDTGPGKKISRFTIAKLGKQPDGPEEAYELIQQAKQMSLEELENVKSDNKLINRKHKIVDEGFVVDAKYTFFSPKYANQKIVFPKQYWRYVKVGHWMKFEALYREESNSYEIIGGTPTGQIVPHNNVLKKVDGKEVVKYLFKIEAQMINNPQNDPGKLFLAGNLYNPKYGGLIADPERKFKKIGRAKNQKLIVKSQSEGSTQFKLIRMSSAEEKMDSERCGKIPNNVPESDDYGLEFEDEIDLDEEQPIMQTDLLSESAIRERRMRARDRRRRKDKVAKLELERQRQLILDVERQIELPSSTSTAAI